MPSKLAQVVIDYYKEDPTAWDNEEGLMVTSPTRVAINFINLIEAEAEELNDNIAVVNDPSGLLPLLKSFLNFEIFSAQDLLDIGNAILTPTEPY